MRSSPLLLALDGRFHFLRANQAALEALLGEGLDLLPAPRPLFGAREESLARTGYLIVDSPPLQALEKALERAVAAESLAQLALVQRGPYDAKALREAWSDYLEPLGRTLLRVSRSAYGRGFPATFWLAHSSAVAGAIRRVPQAVLKENSEIGRVHARRLKYVVLDRFIERIRGLLGSLDPQFRSDGAEDDAPVKSVFELLAQNELILSEDFFGPDLAELADYLDGRLDVPASEFLRRWRGLHSMLEKRQGESGIRSLAELLESDSGAPPSAWSLLTTAGLARRLVSLGLVADSETLAPGQIEAWERALPALQVFELLDHLRRLVLRVVWRDGRLYCPAPEAERLGFEPVEFELSPAMRPLDFASPWVVDPSVLRSAMLYDLTDFSSMLARTSGDAVAEDVVFRSLVLFQRAIDRLAVASRLYREKYLGDGAFYTGRDPVAVCLTALRIQRAYRAAIGRGFPIDRGIRLAINHGEYRLLPLRGANGLAEHYEVFGQGIVELSRLVSGKANQDLEELQLELIARGYDEHRIQELFGPLLREVRETDGSPSDEVNFGASISRAGQLVNEGIVTTASFLKELEEARLRARRQVLRVGPRRYLVLSLADDRGEVEVGIRRLGTATLKGLQPLTVYELIDADRFSEGSRAPASDHPLLEAIDRLYSSSLSSGGEPAAVEST